MPTRFKPIRNVVVVSNPDKASAQKEKPQLLSWLKRHKIRALPIHKMAQSEAVLTLGGDGTILSIASEAAKARVPVLGINTGRLGFMTSLELKNLYEGLSQWIKGRWVASQRMMLEVQAPNVKKTLIALNDAVIRTGATTRVTRIFSMIDKEELGYFVGDGVIVSTPTGSTAYSLSAQGPVVHPDVDALLLTPICAHSFTQRPIVFASDRTLTFVVDDQRGGNEVQLSLDGQRVFALKSGDVVRIRRSQYKLKLLHDPRSTYFGVLREKLLWGERS